VENPWIPGVFVLPLGYFPCMQNKTAIVYVDALNLYYGSLRDSPYKWLNLERLFDRLLPDFEVIKIYFFSADLKGRFNPSDPGAPDRQKAYFKALESLSRVQMVKGSFTRQPSEQVLRIRGDSKFSKFLKSKLQAVTASVWKIEEKGADVSMGAYLTRDVVLKRADLFLLVTRDSDLAGTLEMLRNEFEAPIGVCFPGNSRSGALIKAGVVMELYISRGALEESQLANPVKLGNLQISKPEIW
jgi:hypothetical protein